MIAEIGHYALVLALALALIQATLPIIGARANDPVLMGIAEPAALAQFALVGLSFAALTMLYVTSDFSVANVFENSHSAKPLVYKISGVWGNHEGSMLLWALILALFGAMVAVFGRNLPPSLRANVLGVQSWICRGIPDLYPRDHRIRLRDCRRRRSKDATSIPCCRILASPSIRRSFISAMSASRSRFPLLSQP